MRIFQRIHQKLNWSGRRYVAVMLGFIALGYVASAVFHTFKPLPTGLNHASPMRQAEVKLLTDETYLNADGTQILEHHIFDEMLQLIEQAQTTIVLDMFLFNSEIGHSKLQHRQLTQELTNALTQRKLAHPQLEVVVITDPINSVYGALEPKHYYQMRRAGVQLIETDLSQLRASNPVWSGIWYMCCQGLGNRQDAGWLKNPFGETPVTLRSYLHLANFKANHRKTLVVDTLDGWKSIISSANPHDGSSRHSNVALRIDGASAADVLDTERAVAKMSGADVPMLIMGNVKTNPDLPQVQVLTEKAIYDAVLNTIKSSQKAGIEIDLAMFYLSERKIIEELIAAHKRGVKVRILLDPNKDAFGRTKNGIPNRPVAAELHRAGVDVRWCNTQGEQCHSKMLIKRDLYNTELILGSANFTARNLKNYNLETDVRVIGGRDMQVFKDANQYFDRAWSNPNGRQSSVPYQVYQDESKLKYTLYRLMEWTGLSTF